VKHGRISARIFRARSAVSAMAVSAAVVIAPSANAQQMSCGDAVYQLQMYVAQVNQIANFEYYQGIAQRCGYNQYCGNTLLQQLNYWYQQQAQMVNGWYMQINQTCAGNSYPGGIGNSGGNGAPPELDEDDIEDIEVDDEDRTVRIRIPDNPRGFSPRG
jgi:hypothetical protein